MQETTKPVALAAVGMICGECYPNARGGRIWRIADSKLLQCECCGEKYKDAGAVPYPSTQGDRCSVCSTGMVLNKSGVQTCNLCGAKFPLFEIRESTVGPFRAETRQTPFGPLKVGTGDAKESPNGVKASTGAVRSARYTGDAPGEFSKRFDLILRNREGMEALGRAYGEGILKYGRDNCELGFEESVYIQHAMDHIISYLENDESEDHLGHALWNIFMLCRIRERKPELMDLTGPDPGPNREAYDRVIREMEKLRAAFLPKSTK